MFDAVTVHVNDMSSTARTIHNGDVINVFEVEVEARFLKRGWRPKSGSESPSEAP